MCVVVKQYGVYFEFEWIVVVVVVVETVVIQQWCVYTN